MLLEHVQVFTPSPALFDVAEQAREPGQAVAAGRAPAAGFAGKKPLQVMDRAHGTGRVCRGRSWCLCRGGSLPVFP